MNVSFHTFLCKKYYQQNSNQTTATKLYFRYILTYHHYHPHPTTIISSSYHPFLILQKIMIMIIIMFHIFVWLRGYYMAYQLTTNQQTMPAIFFTRATLPLRSRSFYFVFYDDDISNQDQKRTQKYINIQTFLPINFISCSLQISYNFLQVIILTSIHTTFINVCKLRTTCFQGEKLSYEFVHCTAHCTGTYI